MPNRPVLPSNGVHKAIDALYRAEGRRIFATLVRLLGDFDMAEEALHDGFRIALERWATEGVPDNPRAWIVSAGRFKAIDGLRRNARLVGWDEAGEAARDACDPTSNWDERDVQHDLLEDDRLRLMFTCCHPALAPEAQVALTLREVCGLSTEAIASAFLVPAPTLAQRIVRAKARIREARIPYEVPERAELAARLDNVLRVVYLVFNEGYSASAGDRLTRPDLSAEAIRLGRLLLQLLPEPEAMGLLALMLLHESRRDARSTHAGDLILLEDQDRKLWSKALMAEGKTLVEQALASRRFGTYTVQAAIAALHADAPDAAATDWPQIAGLYDVLLRAAPSPVVELNRAVAIAMRDGPASGLALIDALLARGALNDYHLAHAARADLCRRMGLVEQARTSYQRALELAQQAPERAFMTMRLAALNRADPTT
ncbi:RNA polymerase sigma factor [Variovorax dokdonensis]|uniref:RNA polymerase sigma factor n=1 Tax=Variovorax dokdonensis TaxID=344883 RepID=A0ABT7N571_9BURK|nr:RNA polymerase sigma factor [Variovorax dokdonensis]MDM0043065.1 RNA polymerase sigma factor [Variovorax dokdonensis]